MHKKSYKCAPERRGRYIVAAISIVTLITGLTLWLYTFSSGSVSNDGWTSKEKTALIEFLQNCPKTECFAAYWHPEARSAIVEVRPELTQGSTAITPELAPYLNIQTVRVGLLPEDIKKTLLTLPDQANDIPLIVERESSPPLSEDELLTRLRQCVPNVSGRGVNGYSITIFLEGLLDGLAEGRSVHDFFSSSERQCLGDLHELGYYSSFKELEPASLL